MDSNRFPLQNAIKKILDDPNSRPALPALEDGSSVGDDNFGKAERYDIGQWPRIALNDGNVVVEVHGSINNQLPILRYRLGQVKEDTITWSSDESKEYDRGRFPAVAITNDGVVVEVHESDRLQSKPLYRIGKVEGDTITWRSNSKEYDSGIGPAVAINNNGLVVEVHKSKSVVNDTLLYCIGQVKEDSIDWQTNIEYDNGLQPSVAINDDGLVVEVHSQSGNELHYCLGQVEGDTINWRHNERYDTGKNPSVGITNDGLVVEVHSTPDGGLLYRLGQVEKDTINWLNDKGTTFGNGEFPEFPTVACNREFAVEAHGERSENLSCSVLKLPALNSNWIQLHGENSYCYCACSSDANNKQKHDSNKTMNIKEGAPYFYAVLTKDDDSIDFPTGAVLTITGPDGTKYDRDIEEENQLVIMSGSSVRCLVVKDPKPGDWKMTMTVPEGVGFHCECNTVPSKDVYDTITETLDNSLQKRDLGIGKSAELWSGLTALGAILFFPEVELPVIAVRALWMAAGVDFVSYVVPGKSGDTQTVELSRDEQNQLGKGMGDSVKERYKKGGIENAAQWLNKSASGKSKKKKKVRQYVYAVAYNGRGDFIIGFKNQVGWFFHNNNNGGEVKRQPGQFLNGGDDYALPGGELEESESPIIGAWREFFEETNELLGGWVAQPDVYEGREPPNSGEPPKYYGVYFDLGQDLLPPLFETIAQTNLQSGRSAAEAVSQGQFQGNYNGLRAAFPGCPPDNELKEVHMWNLRVDWQTIQGWQNDQNKSWYYYILNNLRNQLGITG